MVILCLLFSGTNGNINILPDGSGEVLLKADPSSNLGAVTKQYVDAIASGFRVKEPVKVKSTSALTVSSAAQVLTNSSNGAITGFTSDFDGISLSLNNRVLIASQTNAVENGLYYVSDAGSASTPWKLTRTTDADGTPRQ